ncbi:MAG: T9SS type A sorting domain-containing protein [Cyclobacteriaceae bacterium]|nr:T9SS type A sorting domain-containing protein [Cyclobacteriaceae bacterium]
MMKTYLTQSLFLFFWLTIITSTIAQNKKDCSNNCFQTEIVNFETNDEGCSSYQLKITYSGNCESALSHYTVAVPECATITKVSNSENWKQEINLIDPTTDLQGFKIDNISNFGKPRGISSFIVAFTICSTDSICNASLNCWAPEVAYKTGTCVFYDSLNAQCNKLEATLIKTDLSCFESNDGAIEVAITEGVAPFSFQWSNGMNTQNLSTLSAGNYSVTITDANQQELMLETILEQPSKIVISSSIVHATCNGQQNGSVDITVSGGTGGYSYLWSNGATTQDINAVSSGNYLVTVTDSLNCSTESVITITNQSSIFVIGDVTNASCSGIDGAIDISITGGTSPYSFLWSNGSTSEDLIDIESGTYTVNVKDANGCESIKSFNINVINTLYLSGEVTKTGCNDDNSGAVDLVVSGGTAPYSYLWSTGEITEDIEGLSKGMYSVEVLDSNGCTQSLSFYVANEKINVSATTEQPSCYGGNNGSIVVTPMSGQEPYSFEWSNGATESGIYNLSSGVYSVTITDASGCSTNYSYYIVEPQELNGTFITNSWGCGVEGSYQIDLSMLGGTSPYDYNWSNGETSEDLDSLNNGSYSVVVTDANGCTWEQSFTIEATPNSISCLIETPMDTITCNTTGNILNTLMTDADSYSWKVESSDGSWLILSGGETTQINYSAGNEGSTATFTLTIEKDGCVTSCNIDLQSCVNVDGSGDNTGSGDTTSGDENSGSGSEEIECGNGYSSDIILLNAENNCYTYEVTVNYDGDAKHGLSHYTMDIPCGTISSVSNSGNWKNVIGKDPTTGLWGVKIDDINGFGNGDLADKFTINFTLCTTDAPCESIIDNWDLEVSYKAGLCVTYDTLYVETDINNTEMLASAYPNPFSESLTISLNTDESGLFMIMSNTGNIIYQKQISGSQKSQIIDIDTSTWPNGTYYYKLETNNISVVERIMLMK